MGDHLIQVGRHLYFSEPELKVLVRLHVRMSNILMNRKPGWVKEYTECWTEQNRIWHGALKRSHEPPP